MYTNEIFLEDYKVPSECFLWISINKPLKVDFWQKQIEYVEDKFSKIIVLIADEIDTINQINIEWKSYEEALKSTQAKFFLWKSFLEKRIKDVAKKKKDSELWYEWVKNKFTFVSREDISWTERFLMLYNLLKSEFVKEGRFRYNVHEILSNYLKARWKESMVSDDLLDKLSDYILKELVTLIDWIDVDGVNYSCIVYPTFKETILGMNKLAEKLYKTMDKWLNLRGNVLIESSFG